MSRRPDWYRLLLGCGVKPDYGENYDGVWESITHCDRNDKSEEYQRRTVDTYRLLWEDYEERSYILDFVSKGKAYLTRQNRWPSEAVWLFHQSELHLVGKELANFQDAVLRGIFVNCIWDMNHEGLEWLKEMLHTPAGARLFKDLGSGDLELLHTFFADQRVVVSREVGAAVISALLFFGVDVEMCMTREFLRLPLGVVKSQWQYSKRLTFSNEGDGGYALDWEWIYDQSAPGYLLVSELTAFTVDSDYQLTVVDDRLHREFFGTGPLYANRYDTLRYWMIFENSGAEKWPPRFERRRQKKERKERARSGLKRMRTKMPGSWVP